MELSHRERKTHENRVVSAKGQGASAQREVVVQRKIRVGAADDPYEREADQMADRVIESLIGRSEGGATAPSSSSNAPRGVGGDIESRIRRSFTADAAQPGSSGVQRLGREVGRVRQMPSGLQRSLQPLVGRVGGDVGGEVESRIRVATSTLQQGAALRSMRPSHTGSDIQRDHTETGLKKEGAIETFSKKVKARATGGKNPMGSTKEWSTLSVDAKAAKLTKYVNAELKKAHVPPVGYVLDGGSNAGNATFDFGPWNLSIGSVGLDGNLADDIVGELADTVYHESRHGEQWFRIARLKAGESPKPTKDRLATSLGIPAAVAEAALKRPLKPATKLQQFFHSKNWAERQDVKLNEAQSWYDGIYGANGAHRNDVYADLDNRHADYMALVEEVDAWDVGGKAGTKVRALIADLRVKQEAARLAGGTP